MNSCHTYAFLTFVALRLIVATPLGDNVPNTVSRSLRFGLTTSTLDIRVTDSQGNDASPHIKIHNSPHPSYLKEKRGTQMYLPRLCPPGWETINSWCDYARGPLAYQLTCKHSANDASVIEQGRCNPREKCFDNVRYGPDNRFLRHRAYCVTEDDFSQLVLPDEGLAPAQRGVQQFSASTIGIPAGNSGNYALEALVTSRDGQSLLNARTLRIQAQKATTINGHPGRQTLPGGLGECTDCSHVSIDSVPEGVQNVALTVIMPAGFAGATVFIGSIMV